MADEEDNKQENNAADNSGATPQQLAAVKENLVPDDGEPGTGEGGNLGVRDEPQPKVNERQPGQPPAPDRHVNSDDVKPGMDANQANKDNEETVNNARAAKRNRMDSGPVQEQPVFVAHDGTEVSHMDLLNASLKIDERRARIANGTATDEDLAIEENAAAPKQPVPAGWAGKENDLTSDPNGLHPGEKPEQPVGSRKDLNGTELVQKNLPPNAAQAPAKWSKDAQDQNGAAPKRGWGPNGQ